MLGYVLLFDLMVCGPVTAEVWTRKGGDPTVAYVPGVLFPLLALIYVWRRTPRNA